MPLICSRYCDIKAGSVGGRVVFILNLSCKDPPPCKGSTNGFGTVSLSFDGKDDVVF